MNTALDPTAILLDAFKAHRAKLTVEVVDLRRRVAALDASIATGKRLFDQHAIKTPGRAA